MHHFLDITSGEVVGFEVIAGHVLQTGFVGFDQGLNDHIGRDFTYAHKHELDQRYAYSGHTCGYP